MQRRIPPGTAAIWKVAFARLTQTGLSKRAAYERIATRYSVSPRTVEYSVDDPFRARQIAYSARYRQHPAVKARDREYRQRYRRDHDRRPQVRSYQCWYHRLIRRPEQYALGEILSDGELHSVDDIRQSLGAHTGVDFGSGSVSTFLERYVAQARGPPYIEEVEPGVYRAKLADSRADDSPPTRLACVSACRPTGP